MIISSQMNFALTIRIYHHIQRFLRSRQQIAPMVQLRFFHINPSSTYTLNRIYSPFTITSLYLQRKFLYTFTKLKHFRLVCHLPISKTTKQTNYFVAILTKNQCVFFTRNRSVGSHVIGQDLLLKRNCNIYIAILFIHSRWLASFP